MLFFFRFDIFMMLSKNNWLSYLCIETTFAASKTYFVVALSFPYYFSGQFGIPRKWYFPIQKSYWFGESAAERHRATADTEIAIDDIRSGLSTLTLSQV